MGCTSSRLDDLPAVALCRDRCNFLDDAIQHRCALSDAHVAYMQSLKRVGLSLHRFFDQLHHQSDPRTSGDPALPSRASAPVAAPDRSHSNPDSHLYFHSDSEPDSESLHQSTTSSPLHPQIHNHETLAEYTSVNYSKNQPMRSVAYSYPNHDPTSNEYYDYSTHNGGFNGFFGSSASPPPPSGGASASKSPPPPPAPTSHSAWDFLNLFEAYDRYEPPYSPNRSSKGAGEEEVIANLEDRVFEREVAKEIRGDEDQRRDYNEEAQQSRPSVSAGKDVDRVPEYDVHVMEKNVVSDKEGSTEESNSASRSVSDVMKEIQVLLERASESGNEVSKMLEAGKPHYHQKNAVSQVSSKMLHVISPSLSAASSQPSTSKAVESSPSTEKIDSVNLDFDEATGMKSGNLSSTMKKLYMWEKKLYDEVKAEEKLRMIHERKCKQLKCMDEKGAEAHKIDSTRTLVATLSTKIRFAIQVVDKISVAINKLRDEELWLQINELIHGLIRMWKAMLECHRSLSQAMAEAKGLDAVVSNGKFGNTHLEALMQLKLELQNWNLSFSNWMGFQKGYVKALNSWLLRCLFDEPEQTPDGLAPFSPSRMGAPPVFVICNQWSEAMERLSEKEVVEAMHVFFVSLNQLFEQHNADLHQRMIVDKDMERTVKTLEREEQKMQKMMQARDKKMVLAAGDGSGVLFPGKIMHPIEVTNISGLHSGLKQIFEAMETFMDKSVQAYEELCLQIDKDRHA